MRASPDPRPFVGAAPARRILLSMMLPPMLTRRARDLGLLCALLLAGCSSGDEIRPSPLPADYATRIAQRPSVHTTGGRTLDETLAVVDGEVLTRRQVLRRLRVNEAQARSGDVEEEIKQARKDWARQRLVMAAARRRGLSIPPSAIDELAEGQLKKEMAKNLEETGEDLDRESYLKARRLTWREYREHIKGLIIDEYHLRMVTRGIGGARPEVDYAVSPAEVRRIYYDNRAAFDQPQGVRMAILRFPLERFEREGRDLIETEALATREAEGARQDLERGVPVDDVIQRHHLREGDSQVSPEDKFMPKPELQPGQRPGPDVAFIFDPARRPGDAKVFPLGDGPTVISVLEIQQARRRQLPEVYDQIVRVVQQGKMGYARAQLVFDQVDQGTSAIWPPELAAELLADAREQMAEIAKHPVLGKVRLQ